MKRLTSLILCIIFALSSVSAVYAEKTDSSASDNKIKTLTDLGLLGQYEPGADATRKMLKNSVDVMYGTDSYLRYLENRDMESPVLYGQVLMVLTDLTGWTPFIEQNGYSKDDASAYFKLAVKAGIAKKKIAEFDAPITISEYAELLYSAIFDASLLKASYYSNGNVEYTIDKEARLLDRVMNLSYKDGVLTGVGKTTIVGGEPEGGNTDAAIDKVWYKTEEGVEAKKYFGMRVRAYIDNEEKTIRAIVPRYNENNIVEVEAEDVNESGVSLSKVEYYTDDNKTKRITLDKTADFVYNGRLLPAYTEDDLKIGDCTYRFIDNDNDSSYDVIIADKYDNFMVQTVLQREKIIVDKKNNTYKLEDYLDDGGEIRKSDGRKAELADIGANSVISYAVSRDGEYTDFAVSDKRFSGKIDRIYENKKRVIISGTEYKTLYSYYANPDDFDKVEVGDEVEIYLNFNGLVAEIKKISGTVKAGYIVAANEESFGEMKFKILTEDGDFEIFRTGTTVKLNGRKLNASGIKSAAELYSKNAFVPQLVRYHATADGVITSIETAVDMQNSGTVDNDGFTLDFDATKFNDSTNLRALTVNGKRVLYAKYIMDSDTKMFVINWNDLSSSRVMPATSISLQAQIYVKLYNINSDYEPEYIVMTSNTSGIGEWVDVWTRTYIADQVVEEYDEETDEVRSKLIYYDGSGKEYSIFIRDDSIKTPSGNAMPSVKSILDKKEENRTEVEKEAVAVKNLRGPKYNGIGIKDIKRGTVFQFTESSQGLNSFAIQQMPEDNNQEIIFEGTNGTTGANYGTTEYMFNASSLVSYGCVIKKVANGIVINNHATTSEKTAAAELASTTFPNHAWDRAIPMSSSDFVWFYDKNDDKLYSGTAAEIVEGDMIFMQRQTSSVLTVIVYRDKY